MSVVRRYHDLFCQRSGCEGDVDYTKIADNS